MSNKPKRDNVKFLFHTVVWALLIMAFLHTIKPLITPPDPREPEVRALMQEMITVSPAEVKARLESSTKPTLLFIYASWCGYCRQIMPELMEMEKAGKFAHLNLFFLSIDSERRKPAIYLVHSNYAKRFTPYIIKEWQGGSVLGNALQALGSSYDGAIPYIALFNKNKIIAELAGQPAPGVLQNLLHTVPASANP